MIRSVAVLGAGVMGAQIAAHFANAGVPCCCSTSPRTRRPQGLQRARGLKPDPFFTPETRTLITTGGFDDGLAAPAATPTGSSRRSSSSSTSSGRCWRGSTRVRRPGSIVSSNTSGIPIAALAEGRSDDFRRHWLGTHFFNPPRYLRLLEIIPTPETDPAVVEAVTHFADHQLGKGVVLAKDSPNFIGNHLALYGVARILRAGRGRRVHDRGGRRDHRPGDRPAEERHVPDARPRRASTSSATSCATCRAAAGPRSRAAFVLPPFVERMLERGLTGEKAGQGFYKRVKNERRRVARS